MLPLQRLLSEARKEIEQEMNERLMSGRENELLALRREVDQLRGGIVSRGTIERAKGMLMQGHGLSEDQAFELMSAVSQREGRKLRDVAADIVGGSSAPVLDVAASNDPLASSAVPGVGRRARGPGARKRDRTVVGMKLPAPAADVAT